MSNQNHHGMNELSGIEAFCHHQEAGRRSGHFGRMLHLPPLYMHPAALAELGRQGGPMDGGTTAERTATAPVGQVFFGQFVDHDITLDVTSSLSATADPNTIPNARTPTLDLDCVYGAGPEAHPFLYHNSGDFAKVKLLTGADGTAVSQPAALAAQDLVRSPQGTAVIGDPRNDENRIISQLQLAMIRFHNNVVDCIVSNPTNQREGKALYEYARELTTWHYQWVVINDFLVKMCGAAVVADVLGNGRQIYCPGHEEPYIPIEFAAAAYRFGHSMIPQSIQVQQSEPALRLFGSVLGRGFSPLSDPRGVVDWHELVKTSANRNVQLAEKLNSKMATDLLALPFITDPNDVNSLATRNLRRGQGFRLSSGENVAAALGRSIGEIDAVATAAQALAGTAVDFSSGTPLWFYLLVEAGEIGRESEPDLFDPGEGLGPVGARIVAETLIGLAELDPRSYLTQNRSWLPSDGVGVSTLGEMLTFTP